MNNSKEKHEAYVDSVRLHSGGYVERFDPHAAPRFKKILPQINFSKDDIVLDIGCGDGILAEYIADKVKQYIGVDFSEDFIKLAEKRKKNLELSNANFICIDINDFLSRKHELYNKVFALDITEHVRDSDLIKILATLYNSLKVGGQLFIHTPNADFFIERMKSRNFILKQFPEHIAVRAPKGYMGLLEKSGFKNIQIRFVSHYLSYLSWLHLFSYLPFLGKYFQARLFIICEK